MNLHSVKATDWVYAQVFWQVGQAIRAHFDTPENEMSPAMALMHDHGVLLQWDERGRDFGRFTIPNDTPEHIVALTLAFCSCDHSAAIAIIESVQSHSSR